LSAASILALKLVLTPLRGASLAVARTLWR